jgi:hypothetical protein
VHKKLLRRLKFSPGIPQKQINHKGQKPGIEYEKPQDGGPGRKQQGNVDQGIEGIGHKNNPDGKGTVHGAAPNRFPTGH